MKTGIILRGCTFLEEEHTAALESSIQKKTDEISQETKKSFDNILNDYEAMFHEKLNYFEEYKNKLQKEFDEKIEEQKLQFQKCISNLEEDHKKLTDKLEEDFQKHITNTQSDIKEIMMILFEKFFFEQYQQTDNLESLIKNSLIQLEDSKEIQIDLCNSSLEKLRHEKSNLIEELLANEIKITSHSKQDLICEFKTEKGNIEINFKNQIDKIKENINLY